MKKALQNRINLANKYIKFAIKHGIMAEDYFGGTFPVIMTFEKPIEVSPTGRVVTIQWKDGYDMRPHKEKIYPNKFDGEEELRYTITAIIRGIKKGAKQDGWTLSHSGQSFSSKRSNPRKRRNGSPFSNLTPKQKKEAIERFSLEAFAILSSFSDDAQWDHDGDPRFPITLAQIKKLALQFFQSNKYSFSTETLIEYPESDWYVEQFHEFLVTQGYRGKVSRNPRRRKNTRRRIRKYSLRENDAIPTYKVAMENIKKHLKRKGWSIRGDYGEKGDFVLLFKKQAIHIGLKYRTKTESLKNLYGSMHLPDIRTLSMRELDQDIAYYQRILRER